MSTLHLFKNYLPLFFSLLLISTESCGQSPSSKDSYKAENEGWLVDMDDAYAQSKKTGKPIMANFTGSDWCGWCKRLTASVFSQDEFKTWAKKNVILLELDFPRGKTLPDKIKQQNGSLQQTFKVQGFPTVWVFDLGKNDKTKQYEINALGSTGYKPSVQEFLIDINNMLAKRTK